MKRANFVVWFTFKRDFQFSEKDKGIKRKKDIRYLQKSDKLFDNFIFINKPSLAGLVVFNLN
jgi:hypothetical protein